MKIIILVIGIILILYAGGNLWYMEAGYSNLTDYGKGYVFGNVILLLIGLTMIAFPIYKWTKSN